MAKTKTRADYDSPWKEVIERFFPQFIAFFFPQAFLAIDWQRPYEFMDKELLRVLRRAKVGRHVVDKLVKVWLKDGTEIWLLVHIEIQGQKDDAFPRRMFIYNYKLFDRYDCEVVSLAILTDTQAEWKPTSYSYGRWGSEMKLQFPIVKLLDYNDRWTELTQDANPFAIVVMAHLKAQATRRKPQDRLRWKIEIVREMYQRGYTQSDIWDLFRFIDWIMILPPGLEQQFQEEVKDYEEEDTMQYVTAIERSGIEKGMRQRAVEAVVEVLSLRFQTVPQELIDLINSLKDLEQLKSLHKQAVLAGTIEEFEQFIEDQQRKV